MLQVSGRDAHWAPSLGGVPGTTSAEETSGKTQDSVERLYLNTGLGTPWDPPRQSWSMWPGKVWGPLLELLDEEGRGTYVHFLTFFQPNITITSLMYD